MNILKSLVRKRRKNESVFKYILFLLHLWGGILVGCVVMFIAFTGALYVFKSDVEDFSARTYIHRNEKAETQVSVDTLIQHFTAQYNMAPSRVTIPQNPKHNIRVSGGGRGNGVTAFADRETGEFLGESSPKVSAFFGSIMGLHRWFNWKENRNTGKQIVGASTIVFMVLLLSGLLLWIPSRGKKNPWRNKFGMRFQFSFHVWNRDLHMNLGVYAFLFLLLIAWTGASFTYPKVREWSTAALSTKEERLLAKEKAGEHRGEEHGPQGEGRGPGSGQGQGRGAGNGPGQGRGEGRGPQEGRGKGGNGNGQGPQQQAEAASVSYDFSFDTVLAEAQKDLNYKGDLSLMFPGRRNPQITVRRTDTRNWLGARLYNDVTFSDKGEKLKYVAFKDQEAGGRAHILIRNMHTGEILGLPSKILYFLLSLFAVYLPISGYIMWWQRAR